MGFNRKQYRRSGMKVHSWINNPNKSNLLCTKCGIRKSITTNNKGTSVITYTTKDGTISNEYIECV